MTVICVLPCGAANAVAAGAPDTVATETSEPPLPQTPPSIFNLRRQALSREVPDFAPQSWDPAPFSRPSVANVAAAPQGPSTGQRIRSAETNVMELRWHMGVPHAGIPTLEVAGCDLIAPRYFEPRTETASAPSTRGRLGRAGHWVNSAVVGLIRTGCS